jgi:hypothetical protein
MSFRKGNKGANGVKFSIKVLWNIKKNKNFAAKKKKKKKSAEICYDLCKLQSKIKFLAKPTLLTNWKEFQLWKHCSIHVITDTTKYLSMVLESSIKSNLEMSSLKMSLSDDRNESQTTKSI